MLALRFKPGEHVVIGGNITVTVVEIKSGRVMLAFDAPRDINIVRGTVLNRLANERPVGERVFEDVPE